MKIFKVAEAPNFHYFFFCVLVCVLSLSSCTMIYKMPALQPSPDGQAKTLTLLKPMYIGPHRVYNFWGISHLENALSTDASGADPEFRDKARLFPEGTPVAIGNVEKKCDMSGCWIIAYGEVHPPGEDAVAFTYLWGSADSGCLSTAPWEDARMQGCRTLNER